MLVFEQFRRSKISRRQDHEDLLKPKKESCYEGILEAGLGYGYRYPGLPRWARGDQRIAEAIPQGCKSANECTTR